MLCCAIRSVIADESGCSSGSRGLDDANQRPNPPSRKGSDYDYEEAGIRELVQRGAVIKRFEVREAETAGLLVRLKREHLTADGHVSPTIVGWLARLQTPALELRGLPLSDEGLMNLLKRIEPIGLDLSGTLVTNRGIAVLRNATQLRLLDCSFTRVDDDGLKWLSQLRQLRHVSLLACKITDAGLTQFESMSSLRELYLADTRVTASAVEQLQQRLPKCHVE
jgi:hypothetical protein